MNSGYGSTTHTTTAPTPLGTASPEFPPTAQRHPQEPSTQPVSNQQPSTAQTTAATVPPATAGTQAAPTAQHHPQDWNNMTISQLELRQNIIRTHVFDQVTTACLTEPDFQQKVTELQLQIVPNRGEGDCLYISVLHHSVSSPTPRQVNTLRQQVRPHYYSFRYSPSSLQRCLIHTKESNMNSCFQLFHFIVYSCKANTKATIFFIKIAKTI